MNACRALRKAIDEADWNTVFCAIDDDFYTLLVEDLPTLENAFETAPTSWVEPHPRRRNGRDIVRTIARGGAFDDGSRERFRSWVRRQTHPVARDVLEVMSARVRDLMDRRQYGHAAEVADEMLATIRRAPDRGEGLHDITGILLLDCGMPLFLTGDVAAAARRFSEGAQWAASTGSPALAAHLRQHLALVHALEERFHEAEKLLADSEVVRPSPGLHAYLYTPPRELASVLVLIGAGRIAEARDLLDGIDETTRAGHLGWVVRHADALLCLHEGRPVQAIHQIGTDLACTPRTSPMAETVLRADLIGLHQAIGEERAAADHLAAPPPLPQHVSVRIAAARQALLRGRPAAALELLHTHVEAGQITPPHWTPSGAILSATAELLNNGRLSARTVQLAVTAVTHHHAVSALAQASPAVLAELEPFLGEAGRHVIHPWTYRARIRLTEREREILRAFRSGGTVPAVAAELSLSPNTVKSHLRSLYAKLDAHTREDALWLGLDEATPSCGWSSEERRAWHGQRRPSESETVGSARRTENATS